MAGKKSDWVISLWVLVVFPLWWSDLLFLALFLVLFWLVLCGIILAPAIGLWSLDDGYVKHKFQQEETPAMPDGASQEKKSFNWVIVVDEILLVGLTIAWFFCLFFWWDENQSKSAVSVLSALLLLFVNATRLFPDQFKSESDRNLIFWTTFGCDVVILAFYIARCACGSCSWRTWLSLSSLVVPILMVFVPKRKEKCKWKWAALVCWGFAVFFAFLAFVPVFF